MQIENLKKQIRAIDLSVSAGRKRQSSRTGFIHCHPSDDMALDSIPVFENFVFALALFRQKTAESVLEGKALIERLLGFQVSNGNFPNFLHEYPNCWDHHLGLKVAPVLIYLLRDFHSVVPQSFKEMLEVAIKKAVQPPKNPNWNHRYLACLGIESEIPEEVDLFDFLVSKQLLGKENSFDIPFHREMQLYLGNHPVQDKGEPSPLAIEYILAEKQGIGKRLLKDHLHQLHSALIFPFSSTMETSSSFIFQAETSRFLWKGETLHSLKIASPVAWEEISPTRWTATLDLLDVADTGRQDLFEALLFFDISPETRPYINDQKGLIFHLGDKVSIHTPKHKIAITFEKVEGEGDFCGNISRGNRPGQIACRGANQYEAYDWQIGLRTLRRNGPCKIRISFEWLDCLRQDP